MNFLSQCCDLVFSERLHKDIFFCQADLKANQANLKSLLGAVKYSRQRPTVPFACSTVAYFLNLGYKLHRHCTYSEQNKGIVVSHELLGKNDQKLQTYLLLLFQLNNVMFASLFCYLSIYPCLFLRDHVVCNICVYFL